MSNPELDNDFSKPHESKHFALVVDGEVAWFHSVDTRLERAVAAYQSQPTIIELDPTTEVGVVGYDWTYDGEKFVPPAE
jgi:hypothetical protein